MIISELIRGLERLKANHGDIEVKIPSDALPDENGDDDESARIVGIATLMDEADVPIYLMIVDSGTLDALT